MSSYQWKTSPEAVLSALHEVAGSAAAVMKIVPGSPLADAVQEATSWGLLIAVGSGEVSLSESAKAAMTAKDPVAYVTNFVGIAAMCVGTGTEMVDLKAVLDQKFLAGDGVVTLGPETPDDVILVSIKHAMWFGQPFQVIPSSPLAMLYGEQA